MFTEFTRIFFFGSCLRTMVEGKNPGMFNSAKFKVILWVEFQIQNLSFAGAATCYLFLFSLSYKRNILVSHTLDGIEF